MLSILLLFAIRLYVLFAFWRMSVVLYGTSYFSLQTYPFLFYSRSLFSECAVKCAFLCVICELYAAEYKKKHFRVFWIEICKISYHGFYSVLSLKEVKKTFVENRRYFVQHQSMKMHARLYTFIGRFTSIMHFH